MICPKCKSDTKVKDSRPHSDDPTVIRRRRECVGCGHRFNSFESTWDVVAKRQRDRASKARNGAGRGERESARWERRKDATKATRGVTAEALRTGRPRHEILNGCAALAGAARPASPNP